MVKIKTIENLITKNSDKEYILCAAIHINTEHEVEHQPKNIESGFVVCGRRHLNAIITALMIDSINLESITQGFLTSHNRFVDRHEAGKIAFKAGQIDKEISCLTSEDLY